MIGYGIAIPLMMLNLCYTDAHKCLQSLHRNSCASKPINNYCAFSLIRIDDSKVALSRYKQPRDGFQLYEEAQMLQMQA
jgi:hypothetical protein